ncbi:MAG: histidine triad nucleotide-binding protein [Bacillota bacterium]
MGDCPFCRIVQGKAPAQVVYEDEVLIGIRDINPQAPLHCLFIPRNHYENIIDAVEKDENLVGKLFAAAVGYAKKVGLDYRGFRLVVNCGRDGGQTVGHLHVHLLGNRRMTWPPG